MKPGKIFICYRREHGDSPAGDFCKAARKRYGTSRVFLDTDSVPPGAPWPQHLRSEVQEAKVVVAIIHKGWADTFGNTPDWVNDELKTARQSGSLILPLVMGTATKDELTQAPAELDWLRTNQFTTLLPSAAGLYRYDGVFPWIDKKLGCWARRLVRRATLAAALILSVILVVAGAVAVWPAPLPHFADLDSATIVVPFDEVVEQGTRRTPAARATTDAFMAIPRDDSMLIRRLANDYGITDGAASLLGRTDADVLIYATLVPEAGGTTVRPRVVLGAVTYAEDLRGEELHIDETGIAGVDGDVAHTPGVAAALAGQLALALQPIDDVVRGLELYERRRMSDAEQAFKQALEGLTGHSAAIIHQLRANGLMELERFDDAEIEYQAALDADPNFQRSTIGLAEVAFARGNGGCRLPELDIAALDNSEKMLRTVVDRPASPIIEAKASVSLARVLACRTAAIPAGTPGREARATQAIEFIDKALAVIPTDDRHTYGDTLGEGLMTRAGMLRLARPDDPSTADAAADLEQAATLLRRPWRAGEAYHRLALLDPEVPRTEAARSACDLYRRSLALDPGSDISTFVLARMAQLADLDVSCEPPSS